MFLSQSIYQIFLWLLDNLISHHERGLQIWLRPIMPADIRAQWTLHKASYVSGLDFYVSGLALLGGVVCI